METRGKHLIDSDTKSKYVFHDNTFLGGSPYNKKLLKKYKVKPRNNRTKLIQKPNILGLTNFSLTSPIRESIERDSYATASSPVESLRKNDKIVTKRTKLIDIFNESPFEAEEEYPINLENDIELKLILNNNFDDPFNPFNCSSFDLTEKETKNDPPMPNIFAWNPNPDIFELDYSVL